MSYFRAPLLTFLPTHRVPAGPTACMVTCVVLANVLMPFPLTPYLSWGTPVITGTLLANEVTQRRYGAAVARRVVAVGFAFALVLSLALAPTRVALASAFAFGCSQLLDIAVFQRLRRRGWWLAPLTSSVLASVGDTYLFFALAFAGTGTPWPALAVGDAAVKVAVDLVMLLPYRMSLSRAASVAR